MSLIDIDSARGIIRIRHGKGDVERKAMLSPVLLEALRSYWRVHRPADCLADAPSIRDVIVFPTLCPEEV